MTTPGLCGPLDPFSAVRQTTHEGTREAFNDVYPSLGLSASRHAPHASSRVLENPRGVPNSYDPAFEINSPFPSSTSFSRYSPLNSLSQLPQPYDAHISPSRYHISHAPYGAVGRPTSYSSLPNTPSARTSALPAAYEHPSMLQQQHIPAPVSYPHPSSHPSSISGASSGHLSSAATSRSSSQVPESIPQPAAEPINFLQMLQPNANPPYEQFVSRIVNSSDQQASVFLQQKLKVASTEDRVKIVDAIVGRGFEMMTHRFGNWAVQRCLESPCIREDRLKLASVMKGRVVDLATNCYGTHVIQKALDCEEDIKLMILTELLLSDPYATLMNKHSAHVWSRIMELTWADPAPPIFPCVNIALKGRWVELACHETGSLVVQHAFENLEEADTRDLVDEILLGFDRVVRDSWGSWVVQHLLEHGAGEDKSRAFDPQAIKSIEKALKCGGPEVLQKFVDRLCEPGYSKRRAMIVDLALNGTGSQLIAQLLPMVNKDQGTVLYDAIKKHVVTLKGSKAGSRVTWLFDKMRAYYGY
ncbi:armadillo-type protein [Cantharellus anzutake]|uniref:armadillo-type protein n=1 Tax=Cantharellus anzutake TaxID=1750568 RepID=UPI0019049710|nr:armadillo-type protein [Cantharellus anzutake]KAF8336945.1 armadillo-type protein [Cantharellus anzutake]